jgi:hypothetical protein
MIQTAEEFVALRTSTDPTEYLRAASEEATELVWMDVIARYPEMRRWVAQNKTVPLRILEVLAVDPEPAVRFAVAMKNKLTQELFVTLAKDPDSSVRQRIAYNKNVPKHILHQLTCDESEIVATAANEQLQQRMS